MARRLADVIGLITKSLSPLPKYPFPPGNDDTTPSTGLWQDVKQLSPEDYKTLADVLHTSATGEEDDNSLLLERLVTLLSKLPPHSREGKQLTDGFLNQLWDGLEHPPTTVVAKDTKYREADGSNNNVHAPYRGAANTPYTRTVSGLVYQRPSAPDPGMIFDSLMTRGDGSGFREHPNKLSSMMFYLAIIITHDVFQSDPHNHDLNLTSSYLDLAPLYGRNEEEQKAMRTFKEGMIKPDCFSSKRILGFPPGVGVFLVMFNRFHNYVVTQLARVNESNRFPKPKHSADYSEWSKYDNGLFQTGRLVTCGLYVNIVLKDYVRTILNLNRSGSTWDLDPRSRESKNAFSTPAPQATGNQVSVEFNLIYRWHSALSKRDAEWTSNELRRVLGGEDPAKADFHQVVAALARFEGSIPNDPMDRELAHLHRNNDDKTYSDDDLVGILASSIEDVAGAFGPNQVPQAMRPLEILSILEGREWHVATLNEFRAHFGLKKHDTFEDINPDPEVARKLMMLYDSPDSVELYPGIVAEKPKPPMSGSGLCVNYTTSRVILSDAVTLVRGDRFFTVDYTPKNLTNWGYAEANFDLNINQGHVMHKLIFRAFPNHFAYNSIYAHFPFVVPSENKVILAALKTEEKYSWDKPAEKTDPIIIKSHKAVNAILSNNKDFYVPWGEAITYIVTPPALGKTFGKDFCLSGDAPPNKQSRTHVNGCLYEPKQWELEIKQFATATTANLVKKASQLLPSSPLDEPGAAQSFELDIVRDCIIPTNTRFIASFFGLPLKTAETSPHGIYTEHELYMLLTAMFTAVFFDSDPANSFKLRTTARMLALQLEQLVQVEAEADARVGWVADAMARLGLGSKVKVAIGSSPDGLEWPSLPHYGRHLISRMMEKGKTIQDCVSSTVMPISAAGTTIMSGLLSQCLDYYLGDGARHLPELYRLAHQNTPEADETLLHYLMEGIRLRGTVVVARYLPADGKTQTVVDTAPCLANPSNPTGPSPVPNPTPEASTRTYKIEPKQRAIIDLVTASHDPEAFPDPESVRLDRPISSYLPWGAGAHRCLGDGITRVALQASFKTIVGLRGLRRAPGPRGQCKGVEFKEWRGQTGRKAVLGGGEEWTGLRVYLTADESSFWPVPTTMRIRWDGEAKGAESNGDGSESGGEKTKVQTSDIGDKRSSKDVEEWVDLNSS